jgi:hypothetical protein
MDVDPVINPGGIRIYSFGGNSTMRSQQTLLEVREMPAVLRPFGCALANVSVSPAGVNLPTHLVESSYSGDAANSASISNGATGLVFQVLFHAA